MHRVKRDYRRCVLRHFLNRKVAPIAMPLHPSSVKSSTPRRALKRSAGRTDQRRSTCPRTVTPAVALTALAALANEYLPPALGPRTIEDPIPLVDHRAPRPPVSGQAPRSERYKVIVARPRGAPKARTTNPGFLPFVAGATL
jgi:hypothetical protein